MTMPRTRKKTRSINSLADALNVCSRIFSPDEWRVSLNSLRIFHFHFLPVSLSLSSSFKMTCLRILMMEKNSKTSAFLMWETCCCRKRSV